MAIAYFIPDQAKLLARTHNSREAANNQRNASGSAANPPRNTSTVTNDGNPAVNRAYGTTINLTVPNYATAQEPAGCWDFLTQVFCHALRFYHESSQLQPTVIQISVNFQSQMAENPTTAATENTATNGNSNATTSTSTGEETNATAGSSQTGINLNGSNMANSTNQGMTAEATHQNPNE